MSKKRAIVGDLSVSLVRGMPLAEEAGMGALTIPGYLNEVCKRYGDQEAIVIHTPQGVVRWSYNELRKHSVDVAKTLIAAGVGKDTRVGILMTNRPEYLSMLFGIALAGGVSVALSTFSTPDELEHLLSASAISLLVFEEKVLKKNFAAILTELEPNIKQSAPGKLESTKFPFLKQFVRLDGMTGIPDASTTVPEVNAFQSWNDFIANASTVSDTVVESRAASVTPGDAGGLFFSSGTTSLPKGILHSQQAFAIQWWRWPRVMGVKEPARAWTGNGFFWSGNISMIVGVALSTGGAAILQPLFDAEEAVRLIEAERITFLNGRPHQWARLQAVPGYIDADLSSLRYVTRGELITAHPTVDTDWDLPMAFGTTETMTINTSFDADTSAEEYAGSAGVPLPGNLLKIVDPNTLALIPVGERGEICIKGPTLMLGYIGKTLEDCFDDDGYYCTGDGGYVDANGRLFWEGRLNDIIKTGGANVSPEEVDSIIAKFPGIKRSQTVGVEHDTLGEMVVSCIVALEGVSIDTQELSAFLKQKLASFKLPRKVLSFAESDFAMTGNEKAKAKEIKAAATHRLKAAGEPGVV
ncbi:acyl--CoA ligase [Ketobacter sp. MCCC 1A13808]|uniref:class I adenylate-forming enzyme family protein n=1 Tax=Ketobacter sp. MCCC 1A13808 TaxID=2602738 RepID=UPI0012ECB6EE|nr:class I adenylate-forming enzyme family protein [Ketobacter sp. MCCC 1A13808]MVF13532.1 acyl--CoA ligase [Ketobacter sp. MCCC 1A13808]